MYKLSDIEALVNQAKEVFKARGAKQGMQGQKDAPGFYPEYADCCDMADRIAVHSDMHAFPLKLFKEKAPNEDPKQWAYRQANYRPRTMPYWNRAAGVLNRIWNEQNYEIIFPDGEKSEEIKKYFNEEYPAYKSLVGYFESVVTRRKITDPNAVLAIRPREIPSEISEETGEEIIIDNEPIRPVAVIFPCARLLAFDMEEYALIELNEKSLVKDGQKMVREGIVMEFYDTGWIWRIEQTGKKSDYIFTITPYYQHSLGYLPVWKLRGIPMDCEDGLKYKSYFFDAIPLLDEALYDASTLSISKVGAAFPHRWAIVENCDYQGCNGGQVYGQGSDGNPILQQCPSCKGSGKKPMFTPMGVMEVKAGSATEDTVPTPPFGFVEPSLNTLDFLKAEIRDNIISAFAMLNIDVSSDTPTGSETATGKLIDREELHSFLLVFSNELFDLLSNCYKAIGAMRFGEGFTPPVISAPTSFAMRNEADLTEEMTKASAAKAPELALRRIISEYMQTRFSDSIERTRILDIVFKVDSLAFMQRQDIADGVVAGTISKWRDVLHINIMNYIEEAMEADSAFLDKDIQSIRQALQDRAKQEASESSSSKINIDQIVGSIGRNKGNG